MKQYEFEKLEVRFDGSKEQADALRERAEALGYSLGLGLDFWLGDDMYLILYITGEFGFYEETLIHTPKQSFSEFMSRTEQYIHPKPTPCQAHSNQTRIVDIDGEKWQVELIYKVAEPLTATEWLIAGGSTVPKAGDMENYANYRLEHFKTHGV